MDRMKHRLVGWLPIAAALATTSSGVAAYDCSSSTTPDPSGTSYSLIFDGVEGFVAGVGAPAQCDVSAPIDALPPGVVAVYSADYRGFLDIDSRGRMLVLNNGRLVGVVVLAEGDVVDGLFFSGYVGSNAPGTAIDSLIDLELLEYFDGDSTFELVSIDYAELARATTDDLQASVDDLAIGRTALVTHLNATFDLLTGAGRPFNDADGIDFVGGIGSVTAGVNGRLSIGGGFSLKGGAAFVDQQAGGSSLTGAVAAAALRFVHPDENPVRPFGEVGVKGAPLLDLAFSRSYETSTGTTTATGRTTGAFLGAYVTGGVLVAPDPSNEIVFSASLARDLLATAAYDETLDGTNLFAASVPDQLGVFDTVKAGAAWTTRPAEQFDLTFSGAVGATMARTPLNADIAFAGGFTGAPVSEAFVEYGARAGYHWNPQSSVGIFVHAATGVVSGTHAQIGGDIHVRF